MRTIKFETKELVKLFHEKKVLMLRDLKRALGTNVKMTVFRKLKELSYCTSYSAAGKYYTLNEIANYNAFGLWNFGQIHFSKYGSLVKTIEFIVRESEAGYFAFELEEILRVRVHMPLLNLFTNGKLVREQIVDKYLYLSTETHKLQFENRKRKIEAYKLQEMPGVATEFDSPEIKKSLSDFLSILNEKQRRLYVGFEAMKLGVGGDTIISNLTGINVKTIAKGRQELQSHQITIDRIRKVGGGRQPIKKN